MIWEQLLSLKRFGDTNKRLRKEQDETRPSLQKTKRPTVHLDLEHHIVEFFAHPPPNQARRAHVGVGIATHCLPCCLTLGRGISTPNDLCSVESDSTLTVSCCIQQRHIAHVAC